MLSGPTPHSPVDRPSTGRRALADINFGSIEESDAGSSSQEELSEIHDDSHNAWSVIGVSISHAQTRLANPKTPAVEKAAAIEEGGGYFNQTWESQDQLRLGDAEEDVSSNQRDSRLDLKDQHIAPQLQLPSPWRARPREVQHKDTAKKIVHHGFRKQFQRPRSSPGPESLLIRLPFHLPSLSIGSSTSNSGNPFSKGQEAIPQHDSSWTGCKGKRRNSKDLEVPNASGRSPTLTSLHSKPHFSSTPYKDTHANLRRTASDDSLRLIRSISTPSSLGDDSRFEHVSEMVNNRLKAIKDSLQDVNLKIPSIARVSSLRFSFSRADLNGASEDFSPSGTRSRFRSSWGSTLHVSTPPDDRNRSINLHEEPPKTRSSTAGMTTADAAAYPHFVRTLEQLSGDLVILGGYRGSVLKSTEPPHRRLWVPLKAGLNLSKVDLEVGLEDVDEETMHQRIVPDSMLTHIGPVDISKRLFKRLGTSDNALSGKLRVHNYGYDWRLSPHRLSEQLIHFLEQLPSNKPRATTGGRGAIIIAHSLGGLITRHAVNQRPELFAGVVYAGVPQNGVNILGPLRNGDDVLLSSRVLTAQVNFTVRTSYALLPLDGKCFFDKNTKEEYPVDFFDINDWLEYRFSPCINPPLPRPCASTGSLGGIIGSVANALPSKVMADLPFVSRRASQSLRDRPSKPCSEDFKEAKDMVATSFSAEATAHAEDGAPTIGVSIRMSGNQSSEHLGLEKRSSSISTTVTIPRDKAIAYLTRTLACTKRFKEELSFNAIHGQSNAYPPFAVIYGKSEPTVYGAKVDGRDGIKYSDAYDDLAFASGDGVVLARAAMLPEGYKAVKGGVVATDRGHISLLGDLEAVGKCLSVVIRARKRGVGLGRDCEVHLAKSNGG